MSQDWRELAQEYPGGALEVVERADEPGRIIHAVRSWPEITGHIVRITEPVAAWFLGNSWYIGRPSASAGYTLITGELPRNVYTGLAVLSNNADESIRLKQKLPTGIVPASSQFTTESDEAGARAFAATSLQRERALHERFNPAIQVPHREQSPQRSAQTTRLLQDLDRVLLVITEDAVELHRQKAEAADQDLPELNTKIRQVEDTRRAVLEAVEALRSPNPEQRREGKNTALAVMYQIATSERVPRRQQRNEAAEAEAARATAVAEAARAEATRALAQAEELRQMVDEAERARHAAERARRDAEARLRPPIPAERIQQALVSANVLPLRSPEEEAARMHAAQVERARQEAQQLVSGYYQVVPITAPPPAPPPPAPVPPPNTARAWTPSRIPTHPIAAARGPDPCDRNRFPLGVLVASQPPYVNAPRHQELWLDWAAWDNLPQGRITPIWHNHEPQSTNWLWFYGPTFTIDDLRNGTEPPVQIMKTVRGMFDPASPDMQRVFPYFGDETLSGLWAYQTLPVAVAPYQETGDPNRPFVVERISNLTFAVNAELRARRPPEPTDIPYPLR